MKKNFDDRFALTALKSTVEEFEEHMKQYAKFSHIKELREDVLTKVAKFTDLLNIYTKDNTDMRMCVRQFDEALSLKANKSEILTMKQHFSEDYVLVSKWKEIEF